MRRLSLFIVSLFLFSAVGVLGQTSVNTVLLDAGLLIAETSGSPEIFDSFSLTQLEDGTHKLISNFIDGFDQVKSHDLTLTEDFQPISYVMFQSSPAEDQRTLEVDLIDNRAIVSITSDESFEQQTFSTDTEFVIFNDSAVHQLSILVRRLLESGEERFEFDALIPENFSAIPSAISLFGEIDVEMRTTGEQFTLQEYAWDTSDGNRVLRILWLDDQLAGGIQLRSNGTEDLLYRHDLFPGGIELVR